VSSSTAASARRGPGRPRRAPRTRHGRRPSRVPPRSRAMGCWNHRGLATSADDQFSQHEFRHESGSNDAQRPVPRLNPAKMAASAAGAVLAAVVLSKFGVAGTLTGAARQRGLDRRHRGQRALPQQVQPPPPGAAGRPAPVRPSPPSPLGRPRSRGAMAASGNGRAPPRPPSTPTPPARPPGPPCPGPPCPGRPGPRCRPRRARRQGSSSPPATTAPPSATTQPAGG